MKKKLSIVLALAMVCLSLLSLLAACNSPEKQALQLYILDVEGQTVYKEFILPNKVGEFDAVWTSDKEYVVIEQREEDFLAKVVRPESGIEEVTLTVALGRATKDFVVRVKAIDVFDIADNFYFKQNKNTVYEDFDLPSTATYNNKEATIAWEVESDYANNIKVENGKCIVTSSPDGPVDVRIVAKFTYQGETATKYYKFTISGSKSLKDVFLSEIIETPAVNTAYKFAFYQATNKKVYYATGEMSGKYLAATEDFAQAADAKLEAANGGGYFLKLGAKYVTLTGSISGKYVKAAVSLEDTATTVFTIGSHHELCAVVSASDDSGTKEDTFYLGTYGSYTTISASAISYISGANEVKIDDSQFPARLVKGTSIGGGDVGGGDVGGGDKPAGLPAGAAATIDCTQDTGIAITAQGEYTNYEGQTVTGAIQKSLKMNGITVINDIGAGTSAITTQYDNAERGSVRFYAKTTLTINFTGMTKIAFVTDGERNFKGDEVVNIPGATVTVNGTLVVITFTAPVDSAVITLTAQVRVTTIAVYNA